MDQHRNFAYSTVATAPSPATTGTTLVVQSGDGALFSHYPFNATVWPDTDPFPTDSNSEIVRVTNRSTDTLTITRHQESTTAKSIDVGWKIANTITAKALTDIEDGLTRASGGAISMPYELETNNSSLVPSDGLAILNDPDNPTKLSIDPTDADGNNWNEILYAFGDTNNEIKATLRIVDRSNNETLRAYNVTSIASGTIPGGSSSDPGTWLKENPAARPSARNSAGIAYDHNNEWVYLFGGLDASGTRLNDMWKYDGISWTQLSPTHKPSARHTFAMAFDDANQKIVLFGGSTAGGNSNETWTYNPSTLDWTQESPATVPAATTTRCMCFDSTNNVIVMYHTSGVTKKTYTWSGTNWTDKGASPGGSLMASSSSVMTFDDANGQVVLVGGNVSAFNTRLWNGTAWSTPTPTHSPHAMDIQMLGYDQARSRVVLYGGDLFLSPYSNKTWFWDGTDWEDVSDDSINTPPALVQAAMVWFGTQQRMVLFGGYTGYSPLSDGTNVSDETWTYPPVDVVDFALSDEVGTGTFTDGMDLLLVLDRTGDAGAPGTMGGAFKIPYLWDETLASFTDGTISLDNVTPASATIVAPASVDANGLDRTDQILSIDNVNNPTKGTILICRQDQPENYWILYSALDSVIDATFIDASNSFVFAQDDPVWLIFTPSGDQGDAGAAGPNNVTTTTTTDITGILKGNGANISAATQGTDYYKPGGTDIAIADGGTGASTDSGARTNLGLVIGTNVEAHDADLTTIAGLTPTNDDVIQRKAGVWTNRSMAQVIADLAALGTTFQPLDAELTALAGLTSASDKLPYFTGSGTAALADFTAAGRAILDDADAAAQRATLSAAALGANTDITSVLLNQTGLVVKGASSNALTIKPNETLSAGRTLNIIVNDAARTIDLSGNLTVSSSATISGTNTGDQTLGSLGAAASGANTDITSVALNQTGLKIKGGDSNKLNIKPNETLTAERVLNVKVNDVDRTIDLSGNLTVPSAATISGTNTGDQTLPVKASGSEIDTGTDDAKFVTAKAINDSHNVPNVAPGSAGKFMVSDGTDWVSQAMRVVCTSTQAINSGAANTLTDITELVLPMVSGATYQFAARIFYTADVTTTGSRWTVNTTGGAPTNIGYWSQYTLTATTWTYNMWLSSVQLPAASNATSVVAGNIALIDGTIKASANGNFQIQGAREVTTASTVITVQIGSYLELIRIS